MSLIPSHYEINVTKVGPDGRPHHFFATDTPATTLENVEALLRVFKVKFPREEGYGISVMRINCSGQTSYDSKDEPMKGQIVVLLNYWGGADKFSRGRQFLVADEDSQTVTLVCGEHRLQVDRSAVRIATTEELMDTSNPEE